MPDFMWNGRAGSIVPLLNSVAAPLSPKLFGCRKTPFQNPPDFYVRIDASGSGTCH